MITVKRLLRTAFGFAPSPIASGLGSNCFEPLPLKVMQRVASSAFMLAPSG